jgi:hypothetical protein
MRILLIKKPLLLVALALFIAMVLHLEARMAQDRTQGIISSRPTVSRDTGVDAGAVGPQILRAHADEQSSEPGGYLTD